MKLSDIKINSAAEETGRWMPVAGLPGVSFKVRGLGNSDYRARQAKLIADVPRAQRLSGLSDDDALRIETTLLLDTVLLDWKGIEDDDGSELPYSRVTAEKILTDPDLRILRQAVIGVASVVGEDALAEKEGDAKN